MSLIKFLICIFLLTFNNISFSNEINDRDLFETKSLQDKGNFYWLNIGSGLTLSDSSTLGFGSVLSLSHEHERRLYSLRFLGSNELNLFEKPSLYLLDLGLLYGYMYRLGNNAFSISSGVSLIGGNKKGKLINSEDFTDEYEEINYVTIGLPLELQALYIPFKYFGLGITFFGNLNNEKSYYGSMLTFQFGKLNN